MSAAVNYEACREHFSLRLLQSLAEGAVYSVVLWHTLLQIIQRGWTDFNDWNLLTLHRLSYLGPQAVFVATQLWAHWFWGAR